MRLLAVIALLGCDRPERPISPPPTRDAGSFSAVVLPRTLTFELRGPDFEDARGRGCQLEAVIDEPDAGAAPFLRFRCAIYGGP